MSPTYSICKDHGYLTGEQYTCPECGQTTEVYSRITGYYRPVQNWNAGKSQEFKDRKLYVVATSKLLRDTVQSAEGTKDFSAGKGDELILFTTKTCPNCKLAKRFLDSKGLSYTVVDAMEQPELAQKMAIQQAPSLAVMDNGVAMVFGGAGAIKKYCEKAVTV